MASDQSYSEKLPGDVHSLPLVYQYLTHETPLPSPPPSLSPQNGGKPPPDPPDLRPYESPFEWPQSRKSFTTGLSCTVTLVTAYTAGSYSPPSTQMASYWNVSHVAILVGITTFTTGFAVAPMVLAPFSELNGRKPVFIGTGVLFVLCQLCCAVTRSYGGMLAARFFAGVGGSTFSTMVGGVISDIYEHDERNAPMALFSGASLFGTGLGPLVSGAVAQHLDWRWVFYLQVISGGMVICAVVLFFRETRGSVLLSRKARLLNAWYEAREEAGSIGMYVASDEQGKPDVQRVRWKVKADEERDSLAKMMAISCYRPFYLLLTESVVFWFSLWTAFAWAVLYLTFSSIPLVFETNHDFNIQEVGAVFGAMCIGAALASGLAIYQEKFATSRDKLSSEPEGRLYFSRVESFLMPVGLFWFGWTSYSTIHWIVPTMSIAVATMGIFSIYLAVFNYLADTYHRYASSALAAQSFLRNLLGGIFPLFTNAMFLKLGFPGASSLLGGIGILLTGVPWILVLYGTRIRARSKFASDLHST